MKSDKQDIPLLLVGSYWWDEEHKMHRFCGTSKFNPDMSDEELELIPHYFVVGVEIEKVE